MTELKMEFYYPNNHSIWNYQATIYLYSL